VDVSAVNTGERHAPWNPFRCDSTPLPPAWLLAAKLLAFYLVLGFPFFGSGTAFLPFWALFDAPFWEPWLPWMLWGVFHLAALSLFLNRWVRISAIALGACLFLHIAAHRLDYSNNRIFFATFLILLGLYDSKLKEWPLRIQFALIYGGAAINKALEADWWNGRFFDTLMLDAFAMDWYEKLVSQFTNLPVGRVFGMATILTEASICAAILFSRGGRLGVLLILGFHIAMMVATGGQLSVVFLYGTLAVSAAFLPGAGTTTPFRWQEPKPAMQAVVRHPVTWWSAAFAFRFHDTVLRALKSVVLELR
jgi:hypothetical protein